MIGFTGTPISEVNSIGKIDGAPATTNRLFEDCLHKYVITDAIRDDNVLKFSVEYVGRYKEKKEAILTLIRMLKQSTHRNFLKVETS